MSNQIEVHPRVSSRHPDVTESDVQLAWLNAQSARTREFGPPDIIVAAGVDTKGRMIEMIGIKMEDGHILVFHAMKLTQKMARELGL